MSQETIPFMNLSFQTEAIRNDLLAAFDVILEESMFVGGSAVSGFEFAWAEYLGCDEAVAVGNGGDALEIGLRTLGIGQGDEVILPANTFAATAQAVLMVGATPVAVDIREGSNLADSEAVRDATTSRTRAVIAVNLFGERFNDRSLVEWCEKRGIYYCEDAAQSHGAVIDGNRLTPGAAFTAFSFYPGKNLGALGDGGAVVFEEPEHTQLARKIRNYGGTEKYSHECAGRNSRLDSLQAAALTLKLRKLDEWNHLRIKIAETYIQNLADVEGEGLTVPQPKVDGSHVWHLFVVGTLARERLATKLTESQIGWGIHYPTVVNTIPGVVGLPPAVALERSSSILSLPIFPGMTESQVLRVCEVLRSWTRP